MAEIDKRTKQDILTALRERAASYTPEWHFDEKEPDIAAVLAMAYADMAAGTIKKLNGIPLKNKIAFFNTTNAAMLPAEPSEGYVTFSLSAGDSADTEVPAGTVLTAPDGNDDTVHFETTDDVLVSGAAIGRIFCTDDAADYIGEYEGFRENGLLLFDRSPKNLQHHQMTLAHPYLFDVRGMSCLRLQFLRRGGIAVSAADVRALADAHAAAVEYYAGEAGYVPFTHAAEENGVLVLRTGEQAPAPAADEDGNFRIRITAADMDRFGDFAFLRVLASPEGGMVPADTITDGSTEYKKDFFYPFGERYQLYNEVYFAADEALCKKGADITLSFDVSFVRVPMENALPDEEIRYKWIADKSDFKENAEYEIAITEVIWEYYNGYGWSRLFENDEGSRLFTAAQGVMEAYRTMRFRCPEDMTPLFVGAGEHCFIRARILKADNLYKLRGHYLTPTVRNLSFAYSYADGGRAVTDITAENNIGTAVFDPANLPEEKGFVPFRRTGTEQRALYLGFERPPLDGPYRIFWDIRENPTASAPRLTWEYLADGKWRPLNMVDETRSFTRTGFTILLDNHDFTRAELFGREMYYIRVIDADNAYRSGTAFLPIIEDIRENTVRAVNIDSREEEYFAMNVYRENVSMALAKGSVLSCTVYVDETSTLTREETERLDAAGRLIREHDETGMIDRIWVKWNEVNTFVGEGPDSRVCILDRSRGILTFGNGRNGKIPSASDIENIRVVYTTGGGKRSNVDVGQVSGLERSVGFVTSVTNARRFSGGCDAETLDEAMRRSASLIRTQGKAVTARDYEKLAKVASRSVLGVHCCPGYNLHGERENGAVTLVVLKSPDARFSRIRQDLMDYLTPRTAGGIAMADRLAITEPEFVSVNVRAVIAVQSTGDVWSVKKEVEERLRTLLDGAENGSDLASRLGRLPGEQQLRSCIMRTPKVAYLQSIYVTTYIAGAQGFTEVDPEKLPRRRFILPANGTHDISITLA